MTEKNTYTVRLEPVGVEMEVEEGEWVLDAAFRQGIAIPHGCREGQCSSCKCVLTEGDAEVHEYSTFALPDYEKEEGSTLLCRAHAYEDLVIELLNYDEEIIRGGLPLRTGVVEVVSNEPVTHDLRHLVVKLIEPEEIKFFPGQYMDFVVPGSQRLNDALRHVASTMHLGIYLFVGASRDLKPPATAVVRQFARPGNAIPGRKIVFLDAKVKLADGVDSYVHRIVHDIAAHKPPRLRDGRWVV